MKSTITILIILISLSSLSQESSDEKIISFGYGFAGFRSKVIMEMESLIDSSDYTKIVALLNSNDLKEKFLSSIVCLKLVELEIVVLSEEELNIIDSIQNSSEKLNFRFGCTCSTTIGLDSYFQGENPCSFKDDIKRVLLDKIKLN